MLYKYCERNMKVVGIKTESFMKIFFKNVKQDGEL